MAETSAHGREERSEKRKLGRLLLQAKYFHTPLGNAQDGSYIWPAFLGHEQYGVSEKLEGDVGAEDNLYVLEDHAFARDFIKDVANVRDKLRLLESTEEFMDVEDGAVLFAYYNCRGDDPANFGWYRCQLEKQA
jgi:hypothetical protein